MSTAIAQQKIRIRLKAFDRRMLDLSCEKIIETADHTAATAIGPIPLPTKRKIYCVLRSPHVDKDSREHFETRTHRRIIDIYNPSSKTIDALMKLDLGFTPHKIMMIKTHSSGIGDILRSSAAWRALKDLWPEAELHLLFLSRHEGYPSEVLISQHHLLASATFLTIRKGDPLEINDQIRYVYWLRLFNLI